MAKSFKTQNRGGKQIKKDKLLELYQKFKKEDIWIQQIRKLRNCKDEEIDIVLNSKYSYIMSEIIIDAQFNLLKENQKQEIIEMVNNAKSQEVAECIYHIVRSGLILSSGKTIELSKIIYNSEEVSAQYAKNVALSSSVLVNKDGIDLIKKIASLKTKEQAITSKLIAQNLDTLTSGYILELIKIISTTNDIEQLRTIHHISTNKNILSSEVVIKLAQLASQIKSDEIAQLTINIASNKILEKNKRTTYYITRMLLENNYEEVLKIYNEAQNLISYTINQESKAKRDNGLFWNMYKRNLEEAISLLQNKIIENDEINIHTRIKKK